MGEYRFVDSMVDSASEVWRLRTVRDIVAALPLSLGDLIPGLLQPYLHVMPGVQLDLVDQDVITQG